LSGLRKPLHPASTCLHSLSSLRKPLHPASTCLHSLSSLYKPVHPASTCLHSLTSPYKPLRASTSLYTLPHHASIAYQASTSLYTLLPHASTARQASTIPSGRPQIAWGHHGAMRCFGSGPPLPPHGRRREGGGPGAVLGAPCAAAREPGKCLGVRRHQQNEAARGTG